MTVLDNQKNELFKSIWSIADDLRGAVDGWDFKSYILGIMFYRYISENLTSYVNKNEREFKKDFDYAKMNDTEVNQAIKKNLIDEKGFFIFPSELFCNVVVKADNDENLNETLKKIFNNIEQSAKGTKSEKNLKGLFNDIDVNSNKLGINVKTRNKKLATILKKIASIKLIINENNNNIDVFGDAYEYLMSMYASNAGKSGGEFFTPQEVSKLLTKLAIGDKKKIKSVYDPACGSGSLLLQTLKILGNENIAKGFYGQEKNITTYNLCRINMFLHNVKFSKFHIECEDTLIKPQFENEKFEIIVSNPPYSIKWEGDDDDTLIRDERFSCAGVLAPKSKGDMAFIMHSLYYLSLDGTAAIVCFPGIFYRSGAEQKIRKYLIDENFIDCVIQLPDNLFFGTSISTCIMIMKKNKNNSDSDVVFIDASKEFQKITNNNKLSSENIENIIQAYQNRIDKQYMVKIVSQKDIKMNNYNLSVSTYVEKNREEIVGKKIDIKILNNQIDEIVKKEDELRKDINQIIKEIET